jgi:hypothetical protein
LRFFFILSNPPLFFLERVLTVSNAHPFFITSELLRQDSRGLDYAQIISPKCRKCQCRRRRCNTTVKISAPMRNHCNTALTRLAFSHFPPRKSNPFGDTICIIQHYYILLVSEAAVKLFFAKFYLFVRFSHSSHSLSAELHSFRR